MLIWNSSHGIYLKVKEKLFLYRYKIPLFIEKKKKSLQTFFAYLADTE